MQGSVLRLEEGREHHSVTSSHEWVHLWPRIPDSTLQLFIAPCIKLESGVWDTRLGTLKKGSTCVLMNSEHEYMSR